MFPIKEMSEFLKDYSLTEKLFDMYRVVNPLTHKAFNVSSDGELDKTDSFCYDMWQRGQCCKNCISMHTCNEQKQYFKMEFLNDIVYLVFSVPITIKGEKYSLELVKDVTRSMFIANKYNKDNTEVSKIIDQFNEIAVHDVFTGLYNKKYVFDQLQQFSAQDETSVSIIGLLIDIDGLMAINIKHGHHMGDVIIKRIASVLFSMTEDPFSYAARIEGDKFCLFFKDTKLKDVEQKAKKIIEMTSSLNFQKDEETFNVSVSIGTAEMHKGEIVKDYMDKLKDSLSEQKKLKNQADHI